MKISVVDRVNYIKKRKERTTRGAGAKNRTIG